MSEITEIKTLNGYPLADTKARADIATLSKEIADLKGGGETVTETGEIVSVNVAKDREIRVTSDSGSITLIHQGKNFIPSGNDFNNQPTKTELGVTSTSNDDGSITMTGTSTGIHSYKLMHAAFGSNRKIPAGTYTLSINVDGNNYVGFNLYADGGAAPLVTVLGNETFASAAGKRTTETFTIDAPATITGDIYTIKGQTYDCVVTVQLEVGTKATGYEQFNMTQHSSSVPIVVAAYGGANVFFSSDFEPITVEYDKDSTETVFDQLVGMLKFDPTPWGLPILYLTGNTSAMTKDDAVDLSYQYGKLSGTASVKWQGSSSIAFVKKNYTIKFDQSFEAKEGWGAQKKYCFKANWIDASHARNVVCARLWGQVIASRATADEYLATCPNYGAVDGFPCIIMLNGEFHGLYTWNIPKDGWMMNFPTDGASQQCILCANGTGTYQSELFKAEEGAFGEGFDLEYITDESSTDWALTSLNNLIRACIASNGSDLDTTIAPMLDWDSVIDYLCFSAPIGNYDGISKNYLLYTRDGVKWHMGAYDLDCPFGNWPNGSKIIPANGYPMLYSYTLNHRLFELVSKYKKDQFKARYQELRNSVLSEDNIATEFANFIGGIPEAVFAEEHKKWPGVPLTSVNGLWLITDWYRRKVAVIDAAVNAL